MASEKEAFLKFNNKHKSELYNHIRNEDFEFFNENERIGKKELDNLIVSCTQREPGLRPKIADILK